MNGHRDNHSEVLEQLQSSLFAPGADAAYIIASREEVLDRYQPIFNRNQLPDLTEAEMRSFLLFENNRHWTGLHRMGPRICRDMPLLRATLDQLLDETLPLPKRYNRAVETIHGMGRAITTAILQVVHPERYGVWNSTSEAGLKRFHLWPTFKRGRSEGDRYAQINEILRRLTADLKIDLWTLDALWWDLEEPSRIAEGQPGLTATVEKADEDESPEPRHRFGLERHLQDFLWDNWDGTELGQEWVRYAEPGDEEAGYEYPCSVGRIDILARHRQTNDWLVIELKRAQSSDDTVGQVLRYMGWVQEHMAAEGEKVNGLIISRHWDPNLYYALKSVPAVEVMLYQVHFSLEPATAPKEAPA